MSWRLKRIDLTSFGAFSRQQVGDFSPHLNVVYGPNEAGKTTAAALVRGVLFGWEDARGSRNTYKPEAAERRGSLVFVDGGEGGEGGLPREVVLSRAKNAEGLRGPAEIVSDIDKDTFSTMFSLTSDELLGLRNAEGMTTRLLTAGCGTSTSPAEVRDKVAGMVAACTSRAASEPDSLTNLAARASECKAEMGRAAECVQAVKRQDRELAELAPERRRLSEELARANARVEELREVGAHLEKLQSERESLEAEQDNLLAERQEARRRASDAVRDVPDALARISSARDRELRERIDALAAKESECAHGVAAAELAWHEAKAAKDEACGPREAGGVPADGAARGSAAFGGGAAASATPSPSRPFAALALMAAAFAVAALAMLFGFGDSGAPAALGGAAFAVAALVCALAAVALALRRAPGAPAHADAGAAARAAQEELSRAERALAVQRSLADAAAAARAAFLREEGFADEVATLRGARDLLDAAKDARASRALAQQAFRAATDGLERIEESLAANQAQQEALFAKAGIGPDEALAPISAARARTSRAASERDELLSRVNLANERYGELTQELARALPDRSFDELKLAYQQIRTRQNEAMRTLARLLVERRMLDEAAASWEAHGQAEVYSQASELLSLMTEGRWTRVVEGAGGAFLVANEAGEERSAEKLSLSTRQQLYLSLRIALLMVADNVGRAIPVLADDILVNFDAQRRRGAAQALSALARRRQVVLFTCHEEVARTLLEVDAQAKLIELAV